MTVRIGTSGWSYDHWHPGLYPPGLPPGGRLACYAASFSTAELDSSFHRWPLVQLPPALPRDDAGLDYFLRLVPEWLRVAVEFRHRGWHCEDVFALLETRRAAYRVLSGAQLPRVLRVTADFACLRLHGPDQWHLYAGSYPTADLAWWAARIREWDVAGKDVFGYFSNDGNANAVRDARALARLLGQ